jgi:hypothetical protein
VPTNLKLDERLVERAVKLGCFKTRAQAVNTAVAEFVPRRQRRLILDFSGKIEFDAEWDYNRMAK